MSEQPDMGSFSRTWCNMCWIIPEQASQFLHCSCPKTSSPPGPEPWPGPAAWKSTVSLRARSCSSLQQFGESVSTLNAADVLLHLVSRLAELSKCWVSPEALQGLSRPGAPREMCLLWLRRWVSNTLVSVITHRINSRCWAWLWDVTSSRLP